MSHPPMQPHPTHRAPRAYRDAVPRHTARSVWHTQAPQAGSREPEIAGAQTVFYVARGVAVLLAAMAVSLGAVSDETQRPSAAYPTSTQTTTR